MKRGYKGSLLNLTAERAREIFAYVPETGELLYQVQAGKKGAIGRPAGWINRSGKTVRRKVRIDGFDYMAHRVIWLIVTGEWPAHEIDHIDGDGLNNIWANFREATGSENLRNRGAQRNNKTGYKGVCWDKSVGRFLATIKLHGKQHRLGHFDSAAEAHAAYCAAAETLHGEFGKVR